MSTRISVVELPSKLRSETMSLYDALPCVLAALCGPAPVCAGRRPAPAKRRKTMAMAMNFVFFMVTPFSDSCSHFGAPILCAMLKQLLILPHACPPSVARRFEPLGCARGKLRASRRGEHREKTLV